MNKHHLTENFFASESITGAVTGDEQLVMGSKTSLIVDVPVSGSGRWELSPDGTNWFAWANGDVSAYSDDLLDGPMIAVRPVNLSGTCAYYMVTRES